MPASSSAAEPGRPARHLAATVEPPPAHRLLALLEAMAGLVTLAFGALRLDPASHHSAEVVLSVLWLVLALFTALAVPRVRSWSMDVSLGGAAVLLAGGAVITGHANVQVLNGLGLILLGVFAAYTLPLGRIVAFLAISVTAYCWSVATTDVLSGSWVAAVVVGMLVFNTLHVYSLVRRLRAASLVDPLTGALNRNGLAARAPGVRAVAARAGRPTAVALLDLDRFKQVNDRLGHAAGDALLVDLVRAWSAVLRPSDQVARVGGDEFVIVLPACDVDQAQHTLERLRSVSPCPWTAGTALWDPEEPDVLSAVEAADDLMYRSKGGH